MNVMTATRVGERYRNCSLRGVQREFRYSISGGPSVGTLRSIKFVEMLIFIVDMPHVVNRSTRRKYQCDEHERMAFVGEIKYHLRP